jgi:RNA polymerase sigma-70 factor (ECF subfamily)
MGDFQHSTTLQRLLDLLRTGHPSARDELIAHALERLRRIAHHMLRRRPDLRGPDTTSDVLQKSLLRVHRAMANVHPASVREFFGLAARQTRWVLLDMLRQLQSEPPVVRPGQNVPSTHKVTPEPLAPESEPSTLAEWSEFHQRVEQLPEEVREVFDLIWYQGLSQEEVAEALGISHRTVQRRWMAARLLIQQLLRDGLPGE